MGGKVNELVGVPEGQGVFQMHHLKKGCDFHLRHYAVNGAAHPQICGAIGPFGDDFKGIHIM